ncbi:MAG: HD domain-containing protein [Clostridia bacterium]|nr:HD domain-containing protein [Clostridia bacterium]
MNYIPVGQRQGTYDLYALVKRIEIKTSSKGQKYMDLTLGDKDGDVDAKYWDYEEGVTPLFEVNTVVKVRGQLQEFRGAPQFRVDAIRATTEADNIRAEDYIAVAEYPAEAMYLAIVGLAENFKDRDLADLLTAVYEKYKKDLLLYPAAVRLHHAMQGGLLYHTLSILRMCQQIAALYPAVDEDLLLCGAALHDLGKLVEMDANELGLAGQYTTEGNLLGHLVVGAMMVRVVAKEIGTPEDKAVLIEHMLISHHGRPEFGAAVPPKFLEAIILSKLDELDATIYEINDTLSNLEPGTFSARLWNLDDIRLFHHGRVPGVKPGAKLFKTED